MRLPELYARAEDEFQQGNYVFALQILVAVVQVAPHYGRARYRVADALLNLGATEEAKSVYRALAWYFIKTGQPLLGLVVSKMLVALDPAFADLLEVVTELYSSASDRVGDDVALPEERLDEDAEAPPPFEVGPPKLLEWSRRIAADVDAITVVPDRLPRIPLFSLLPEDAFGRVLHSLRLRRIADGEAVVREGEPGDAFFMLADGRVKVTRRIDGEDKVLANLRPGAVFGEIALVSRAPRTATVWARGEAAVLALSRDDVEVHAGQHQAVTDALRKFTRGRLLANLAATSPLFAGLDGEERRALMRRFVSRATFPGDLVIEQGEPGRGLWVVLRGDYDVSQGGRHLASLGAGQIFGEIALLRDAPTTATVTSRGNGELLFLGRDAFADAMQTHAPLLDTLRSLSSERLRANRLGMFGVASDDASVMV
jgi:CRP-like cAMP-binding protein